MRPGRAAYRALEQSLTSDNSYLSGMGNAINGTVNHQVGETIKGDAPSPIIKAIQAGQLSKRLLKALLAEGANVNYSSQIYGTPLMTACSHGPLSVVELLLRHGADPNKGRSGGKYGKYDYTTPLAHCCDCKTRFISQNAVQLCRLLIEYGAAIDGDDSELGGRTPLVVASSCGRLDLMRLLLDRGAGVDWVRHPRWMRHPCPTVLTVLCESHVKGVVGIESAVAKLLISRGAEVDNETGRMTPLKLVQNHRTHGRISYPSDPDLYALFDPVPPPPRIRLRTHWRLRIAFHVIGRRASNPRSKRHELGLYRVSDIASFLLPRE